MPWPQLLCASRLWVGLGRVQEVLGTGQSIPELGAGSYAAAEHACVPTWASPYAGPRARPGSTPHLLHWLAPGPSQSTEPTACSVLAH